MSPKKWSEVLNAQFIEAYKEKECLWNHFHPLYKNKYARDTALKKLAEEMDLDDFGIVEVKAKIKALRSTYNLEVEKQKKSEKSGAGIEDLYVPTLKWFINTMKDIMTKGTLKRKTQSNLAPVNQAIENDETEDIGGEPSGVDATSPELVDDPQPQPPTPKNTQDGDSQLQQPPSKKFKPRSKIQQIAATANQLQQLNESLAVKNSEENEWDVFGKLVATHLKKLSPRRALEAELKIHTVLNECRMQDLMHQTFITPQPGSSVRSTESCDLSMSSGMSVREAHPLESMQNITPLTDFYTTYTNI